MRIHRSIVLTALMPSTIRNREDFAVAVHKSAACGLDTIEFFTDFSNSAAWGNILHEYGLRSVYLAAYYQKKNGFDLCAVSNTKRQNAIDAGRRCIDAALEAGAQRVVISGGRYPDTAEDENLAWEALADSICFLMEHSKEQIAISLEPGDRDIEAMQLLGPTKDSLLIAKLIKEKYKMFWLTMDTSHIAQLGEDPRTSLTIAAPYFDHVHIANCILDPTSALYGDKHPSFDTDNVVYSRTQLKQLTQTIISNCQHPDITVGIEVISAGAIEDLHNILNSERWLFEVNIA